MENVSLHIEKNVEKNQKYQRIFTAEKHNITCFNLLTLQLHYLQKAASVIG